MADMFRPINPEDVVALNKILDKFPKDKKIDALEVGSGLSTEILLPRCNLTILEIINDRANRFAGKAELVVGASQDYKTDKKFDLIFIDGDHTYGAIKADLDNLFPMLKPGGIISGHDYEGGGYDERYINVDCVGEKHHGVIKAVDDKFKNVNKDGICVWWWSEEQA